MLAVAASVGTLFAQVQIGDLYYNLDATNQTAELYQLDYNFSGAIVIPSSVTYNSVTYSVTSIGEWAFCGRRGLTSVTIPNSVTSIEGSAFNGCTGLRSVTIGNSVTSIGNSAFRNCTGLTSVTIPNSVTSIGEGAFRDCSSLISVTIGNSVTSIEGSAFDGCTGLRSVTIGNSVTSIGKGAFYYCKRLTSVTIPNSVTSIGEHAFRDCYSLTSVTIGNSVTSIGSSAFYDCSLTSVTIPNSVTRIGEYAFSNCTVLTSIDVASDNSNYCSVDGVLFNKDKTTLIQYPGGKQGAYTIPNSVTSIGKFAFYRCTGLTSIIVENGNSFYDSRDNCNAIIETATNTLIAGCKNTTIPNSVTSIGNNAFELCTGLTSVTIPNSVTSIGEGAFCDCYSLTSITCESVNPPSCKYQALFDVSRSIPLYVPANSINAYKTTSPWSEWGDNNIKPIQAEEAEVTAPHATPTENSVVLDWPKANDAVGYTIYIKKGDLTICTLSFNALGQLLTIAFAAPARNGNNHKTPTALQTTIGLQYTIGGLDPGTEYSYIVIAKRSDESEAYNETVPFKTTGIATSLNQTSQEPKAKSQKLIKNGQLLIEHNGKTYNVMGGEIR